MGLLAIGSALMAWMAFPPWALWPLAWIAPVGWIRIVAWSELPRKYPYRILYAIAFLQWVVMIQWVRLPHWTAGIGMCFLAAYLAIYVPLFIGVARIMVHRWRWSLLLVAPIAWTGLEVARGYLFTGFALMLLGHTQVSVLPVLQIADLFGAYGVSFLIVLVSACFERLLPMRGRESSIAVPVLVAFVALAATLVYGGMRLSVDSSDGEQLKVALIQGSFDTQFDGDYQRNVKAFQDYVRLTQKAVADQSDYDLVIWPESMFTANEPMVTYDVPLQPIPEWDQSLQELQQRVDQMAERTRDKARWIASEANAPLIVGGSWEHLQDGTHSRYNAAMLIEKNGELTDRYFKMHPVMFGEYLPLGGWIPSLYQLSPMGQGLTAGLHPKSFDIDGVRIAPSICFENTVPHLMRRQIKTLAQAGQDPDVLVTITNDGWFWGSSALDVHLACAVFRAIELRRPLLIAANTGFSAHIDADGRLAAKGPRREEAILSTTVNRSHLESPYLLVGDLFPGLCLLIVVVAFGAEGWNRVKRPKHLPPKSVSAS